MPGYISCRKKKFSRSEGKWVDVETTSKYDYTDEDVDNDGIAYLISFFRWYPDYFADLFRAENAKYELELAQRIMLRTFARYRNVYITGVRGLTKTFIVVLHAIIDGILYPGSTIKYCAPEQKQAAKLATQAFHSIEECYPILTSMWKVRNDRADMFYMTTDFGSSFSMYVTRGDNADTVIGEECGQEAPGAFPMDHFTSDIYPIVRNVRMVNQHEDTTHIHQKHLHIANACSKTNQAFTELRRNCLRCMYSKNKKYDGFVFDASYITALVSNVRDISYFQDLRNMYITKPEKWLRECCARYTGTGENPMILDENISRARRLMTAEFGHCGDANVLYIIAHDVSYSDGARNAKCADVVLKLSRYTQVSKKDVYKKQAVFVDAYAPPKTYYEQAMRIKALWKRFCMIGGQPTYIILDANGNGDCVLEELLKPCGDNVPICCVDHSRKEIEQKNALPVIYPLKSGLRGKYDESTIIENAQGQFAQGNIELLTSNTLDGVEQYKLREAIKDGKSDMYIAQPYKRTDELCQQIENLQAIVSGMSLKEKRKSKAIQRDIWSALKYGLFLAKMLEKENVNALYSANKKSNYKSEIERVRQSIVARDNNNTVNRLLGLCRR